MKNQLLKKILKLVNKFRILFIILFIQFLTFNFYINFIGFNIYSVEKTFKKGDKKVILTGIAHIAEKEFFDNINERYLGEKDFLLLLEGVRNPENKDFIKRYKDQEISHEYSANILGLDYQKESFLKHYNHINSDVSIDQIDINILDNLFLAFVIWKNLALFQFDELENNFNKFDKNLSLLDMKDKIIIKRNNLLKQNIISKKNKTLIIPWGALHHNDLEDFLIMNGYKKESVNRIKVANMLNVFYNIFSFSAKSAFIIISHNIQDIILDDIY